MSRRGGDCRRCHAVSHGRLLCSACTDEAILAARARRVARAEAGLCGCGRRPRPGHRTCEPCAADGRKADAIARARRKVRGLCRKCPKRRDRTSPFCASHRLQHNAYNVTQRQRRIAARHEAWLRADIADEAWGLAPSWAPTVPRSLPREAS